MQSNLPRSPRKVTELLHHGESGSSKRLSKLPRWYHQHTAEGICLNQRYALNHPTKLGYTHTRIHIHTHVHIYTRLLRDSEESRKSRKLAHRQAQDLWQDLKLQGPQENQPKTLVGKSMTVEGCGSREESSHELGVDSPARHPTLSPDTIIQPHPPHTESLPWLPLPGTLTHFLKWMPPWSPLSEGSTASLQCS